MAMFEKDHIWGDSGAIDQYPHNSYENPWDGSSPVKSRTRSIAVNLPAFIRLSLIFWSILILFFLAFAGTIRADKNTAVKPAAPKTAKPAKDAKAPSQWKAAEIGEEYVYLLEQLLYLSSDYCRYFDKLDAKAGDDNYQALANMCARISKEEQYENVTKIIAEMDKLKIELSAREKELSRIQSDLEKQSKEVKPGQSNLQALKLTISLREELEALDEQMQHDVVWRLEKNELNQEAIQEYVNAVLNDSLIKMVRVLGESYAPQVRVYRDATSKETKVVVATPDVPGTRVIYVPGHPDVPTAVHPNIPDVPTHGLFADASFYKEFSDSIEVTSSETDIYITNAIGNISVTGGPHRQIGVSYVVAIESDKLQRSEEFDQEVHLRITPKQNKIYIESVVPPLDDPKMRVLESRLELTVPRDNDLFLSNTSGTVSVNDTRNDVTVKTTSCNIDLHRVDGNVEISNSSGAISAGKVNGSVIIQNRTGPITLFNCRGTIEMDNSFGAVSITDCDGDAAIRNTGAITVGHHSGNMEITNRSGEIDVTNLDGNLAAFNSFEPLRAMNINGDVKLINANASIDAFEINGMATISNRFGAINISGISGPIQIENRNGDITMHLSSSVAGPSNVISQGGQVFLSAAQKSNLLLTIESAGGGIDISGLNAKIEDGPQGVQLAKLTLGNGSNLLNVRAGNSKIFVKPAQKIAMAKAP